MPKETLPRGVEEKRTSEGNQQISGRELYSKLNILILKLSSLPDAGHFMRMLVYRGAPVLPIMNHSLMWKKSRIPSYQGVLWISRITLSFSLRTSRQERT
jgi:hypothetical protein